MTLPAALREEVEAALGPIRAMQVVGGGCVNASARLEVGGGTVFLKHNEAAPERMFAVEAAGLAALRAARCGLRVPEVLEWRARWLALEWLGAGRGGEEFHERLGRGLAALHAAVRERWGWEENGFIGPLPQANGAAVGWADFWWRRRLEPQLRLAERNGARPGTEEEWARLAERLPVLLTAGDEEGPSLLHGDLWGGNVLPVAGGEAGVVDPAAYLGHREVDLAMSELFGGFGTRFHDAYREALPLRPGYPECRRHVYQLYYLLVHLNLFGARYHAPTAAALRRALAWADP